jgi:1-deoxyxylulose-5-phosphate synthase
MEIKREFTPLKRSLCRCVMGTSFGRPLKQSAANALFDAYVEQGGNCFDTALVYFDAEQTLGHWIKSRNQRENIVIHAKGAHHETLTTPGSPYEYHRARVTPTEMENDLAETLQRLQTDYVDIYTLHRDDPDQPVGPIIDCLARLKKNGRIRAFGASNWTLARIGEANAYAQANGLPGFDASSPNLSLAYANEPSWPNCVTACDSASLEYYTRTQMPLFAWSCLALGFFSNHYQPLEQLNQAALTRALSDRWSSDVLRVYYSPRNFERLARANQLAQLKGATATQIALAWLLHLPLNLFAVAGPRTPAEIAGLFEAFKISLTAAEVAWLNLKD